MNSQLGKQHRFIAKEPISQEEFDKFLNTLTRELILSCGLRDSSRILSQSFIRIQNKLDCRSISDCVQNLVDRLLEKTFRFLIEDVNDITPR